MESSAFVNNGSALASSLGGVTLAKGGTFRFNTLSGNLSGATANVLIGGVLTSVATGAGVHCAAINTPVQASLFKNNVNGGSSATTATNCVVSDSNADVTVAGTNNRTLDPRLESDGVHLNHASPLRDLVTTATCPGRDIDFQPRPVNARCEIGADELP